LSADDANGFAIILRIIAAALQTSGFTVAQEDVKIAVESHFKL
jgi:hypothetical protein